MMKITTVSVAIVSLVTELFVLLERITRANSFFKLLPTVVINWRNIVITNHNPLRKLRK
jgi:hypothetical protein